MKEIELKFDNRIYRQNAIKKGVSAYSAFAVFKICKANNHTKVRITKIKSGFEHNFAKELANFILAASKQCL